MAHTYHVCPSLRPVQKASPCHHPLSHSFFCSYQMPSTHLPSTNQWCNIKQSEYSRVYAALRRCVDTARERTPSVGTQSFAQVCEAHQSRVRAPRVRFRASSSNESTLHGTRLVLMARMLRTRSTIDRDPVLDVYSRPIFEASNLTGAENESLNLCFNAWAPGDALETHLPWTQTLHDTLANAAEDDSSATAFSPGPMSQPRRGGSTR